MPEISHLNLSDVGLVFDSRSGDSYQINQSASLIIKLLQNSQSDETIATALAAKYNLSPKQALLDVLEFKLHLSIVGLT